MKIQLDIHQVLNGKSIQLTSLKGSYNSPIKFDDQDQIPGADLAILERLGCSTTARKKILGHAHLIKTTLPFNIVLS